MTAAVQQMEALALANERRLAVAEFKRRLRHMSFADALAVMIDVLTDTPEELRGARVAGLLRAVPRFGEEKVSRLLVRSQITTTRQMRDLSDGQRRRLIMDLMMRRAA